MGMERWGLLLTVASSPIVYFLKTTRAVCPNITPIMLCTFVTSTMRRAVSFIAMLYTIIIRVKNSKCQKGWPDGYIHQRGRRAEDSNWGFRVTSPRIRPLGHAALLGLMASIKQKNAFFYSFSININYTLYFAFIEIIIYSNEVIFTDKKV